MIKTCSVCGDDKPEEDFDIISGRGTRKAHCSDCRRKMLRQHYANNKQYYVAKSKKRNRRVKVENKERIIAYLLEHPCVDCGEANPIFLEFDHVRGKKILEVTMLMGYSWEKISTEIEKCDIRCVKCHRMKTYRSIGWWGFKYLEGQENGIHQ